MTTATHTPGPWKIYRTSDGNQILGIGGPEGDGVTDPRFGLWGDGPEREANARLIAAAPDLLEALRAMAADFKSLADSGDAGFWLAEDQPIYQQAMAAISKAEGRDA